MGVLVNIIICATFIICLGVAGYFSYKEYKKSKLLSIPFKEAMDLVNLPIVTFEYKDIKLHMLLDTGSDDSYIDADFLPTLGIKAKKCNDPIITGAGELQSSGKFNIDLIYNGHTFETLFLAIPLKSTFQSLEDNRGIRIHGIIGSKFFRKYQYKLDFDKMIASSNKSNKL